MRRQQCARRIGEAMSGLAPFTPSRRGFGSDDGFSRGRASAWAKACCVYLACLLISAAPFASQAGPASADRETAEDTARRLANLASEGLPHPRLHLRPGDRERLREESGTFRKPYWEKLCQWLGKHKDWQPPADVGDDELNEVQLEQGAAFLTNAAMVAYLSGEAEHVNLAKRWALAMSTVPRQSARNYGYGIYAAGLARAYDWLYDYFSPQERGILREQIAKIVRYLYEGSFPGQKPTLWWAGCYLHHDFWIPVGGYGEAALALLGEVDEAAKWAAGARAELREALSWLGDDGAWHEGPADWCYAMAPLLWFLGAWQSVTGESLHDVPWLRHTAAYRLYHRLNDETYVYLDDSFPCGRYNTSGSASSHLLRRLASLFRDGHAQWLAARDEVFDYRPPPKGVPQAPYEGISRARAWREYPHTEAQCATWNFLWFDPAVPPRPPHGLSPSRHFENLGIVILRSDWSDSATVVSLSCGPLGGHRAAERMRQTRPLNMANFYHVHADYSDFTLYSRGNYFIIPPGYARRDSEFHNTIAVNGAHFVADPLGQPRIAAFGTTASYDYAIADAREGFPLAVNVAGALRYVVLVRPDWVIVYDDVRLASRKLSDRPWRRFDWFAHSDPLRQRVEISGNGAQWRPRDPEARDGLAMKVIAPEDYAWQEELLSSRDGDPLLYCLKLTVSEWYRSDMHVLSVWHAQRLSEKMEAVSVPARNLDAVQIVNESQLWVLGFWRGTAGDSSSGIVASYAVPRPHRVVVFGLPSDHAYRVTRAAEGRVEVLSGGTLQPKEGGVIDLLVE